MTKVVDEFYTAMYGAKYVYVAGRNGLDTALSPRRTLLFRGDDARTKLRKKITKHGRGGYMTLSDIKIVKVTVEQVND